MDVRRFRWWAEEAAAVEEEERDVERRAAAKRRKRSVAELFAAVPRVPGAHRKRAVHAKEKDKGKFVLAVELNKASKGAKKKKKEVPTGGIAVSKKEKNGSAKVTSVSISQLLPDSTRKRKPNKSLSNKKRNQEVLVLEKKCKKGSKISVLDSKKNAITNSVQAQSMLEKQSKVVFDTLLNNKDVSCKPNSSCRPKHVTFSHGNDIFGWTVPLPEDNTEQPKSVHTSQRPFQEVHDQRSREELQLVYQGADATPEAFEEDTSSLSETVVSTGVSCIFPGTKPKGTTIVGSSVDLNHRSEISNNLASISMACLPSKMASQNFDGVDSCLDDAEDFRGENHVIPQGSSNPVSLAGKAISNDIYRGQLSQSSSSYLNYRNRSTIPEVSVANCHLGKVHHKLARSGKDVVSSISSLAESNKTVDARATDCVPACKNTYLRDDYVGLPLNSRGEFVKLHPAGVPSYIDILKRQCIGESSPYHSAFPTFFSPRTSTDRANLRPKHHVPQIEKVDQSPHFTPIAPIAYETDFRQLSCSERMKTNKYAVLSNKYPCTNQQELSPACFCSECMVHHNSQQKLHAMQSYSVRRDGEQNTLPAAETTMRLMGKTVTLGSNGIQCRYPDNETPGCSKQTPAEDHSFLGARREAFPQSFHGELVYPPYAFRISHGERELPEGPSFFPLVSASELRSELQTNSFRTNGQNQQPELAAANSLYVQPAAWSNESALRHQQPVRPNQVQSSAGDMLLGSMQSRDTQSVASVPSFDRRNSVRNFMEKRPVPYQPGYFTQHFSNVTQRNPMSSSLSGYAAVQRTPGLTTETKFTSLPPLPPSLTPSPVYSPDYAQLRGSTTNHPSIPAAYPTSKSNALGNAICRDERVKWTMMGSNVEGLGHLNGNGKRPADKDDVLLASPKKPCTAAPNDLHMLPAPKRGLQFFGSRPGAQPAHVPVGGFRPEPQSDVRLGSQGAHTPWSYPVNTARPAKLKPGARHILEPSSSSMSQGISWTVHSAMPMENGACAGSTSKNRDTEVYQF
ncbi:hypothetical protein EJB05_36796, partial [Eragrostis curvula]